MEVMVSDKPAARELSGAAAVERDSRELFTLSVRAMEASEVDLRPSGLRALLALDELGSCTLGELADHLALSQSATSRLVDKLVLRKLINRRTASHDRRQVSLSATVAGRRATAALVRRRREAISVTMALMDGESREQLRIGLHAFADVARGARPVPSRVD
jgi:DNA-binding MarR family transcriptional regulator